MITKNECALIWKIRHGVIPTGRFMYVCEYTDSLNCNYCSELNDLTHIFVTCSRLSWLFQQTQSLIRKLTPTIVKNSCFVAESNIESKCGISVCQISEYSM